jgi:hypothetical protein
MLFQDFPAERVNLRLRRYFEACSLQTEIETPDTGEQ